MLTISIEDVNLVQEIADILNSFKEGERTLYEGATEVERDFTHMNIYELSQSELFELTYESYLAYYGSRIGFDYTSLFVQFVEAGALAFNKTLYRMRNLTEKKLTVGNIVYYNEESDSFELLDNHYLLTCVLDLLKEYAGL